MRKTVICAFLVLCGCAIFERAPELQSRDVGTDDGEEVSEDLAQPDTRMEPDATVDMSRDMDSGTDCGNDIQEGNEACDGSVSETCRDRGYDGGELACSDVCTVDESSCWRCDYFVDSEAGDDGNDGSSDALAFGTLEPIRALLEDDSGNPLGATWRICLKRGSSFALDRSIEMRVTGGDSRQPLTITAYGPPTDPLPVVSASTPAAPAPSVTYPGAQEVQNNGRDVTMIWEKTESRIHIFNPLFGGGNPSPGNIVVENGLTHYVPANGGVPDPDTHVLSPAFKIPDDPAVTDIANYVVENIRFEEVSQAVVFLSSYANVSNVVVRGIEVVNAQQGVAIGNLDQTTVQNIVVEDSTFSNTWIGIAITLESLAPAPIVIRRNRFEDMFNNAFFFNITSGVTVFGAADPTIVDNAFFGDDEQGEFGIFVIDFFGTLLESAPTVERNQFWNLSTAFNLSSAHRDTRFANNIVVNTQIGLGAAGAGNNSLAAYNTFYGTTAVSMSVSASNWTLVNNYSDIDISNNADHISIGASTVVESRNNAFVPTGDNEVFRSGNNSLTFAQWKAAPTLQDINSISPNGSQIVNTTPTIIDHLFPIPGGRLDNTAEYLQEVPDDFFETARTLPDPNNAAIGPDIGAIENL